MGIHGNGSVFFVWDLKELSERTANVIANVTSFKQQLA